MVNPNACEIKVLMLLYSPDKKAYIGFIPNDQAGFVDRIRKVIQQQKSKQVQVNITQLTWPSANFFLIIVTNSLKTQQPPGPGQAGPSQNIAQTGPNILVTQTNPLSMGGGQMSAAPQPQQQQQQMQQPQMIGNSQQPAMAAPAPMANPVRGAAPTPAQLVAERQQNLMTIKQLQQTLEAAQQKDIHLKALVFSVFPYV